MLVEGSRRSRIGQRTLYCSAVLRSVISDTLDTHLLVTRVVFRLRPVAMMAACWVENHNKLLRPPALKLIASCSHRQHVGSLMSAHMSLRSADGVDRTRFDTQRAPARARVTTLQGIAHFVLAMHHR
jgi:hypothetical protein